MSEEAEGYRKKELWEFEPLLDSEQAAALLHVHPETLKRRARRGEIPGMKFGKVWRFRASGLNAYIRDLIR
ncbi:MAG: helix-turn-helix domain-containing protein [Acidobacteria bacterium]|nr:helix-turn-helix domain-containing protein [Acidobacteriota bacterium]MBW4045561.1 helix-turn-helix domain-containing protein [Acidobacteriota bacterium]